MRPYTIYQNETEDMKCPLDNSVPGEPGMYNSFKKGDPIASRSPLCVLSTLPGTATGSPHLRLNPDDGQ